VTRTDRVAAGLLVLLLCYGLARAAGLAWVCDDSFISLRYAENLVDGHGLVYNVGERVEGYTNLLWTLLLATLLRAGLDPLRAAELPGLLAYLWLAALLAGHALRRTRATGAPFLPVAAGFCLVSEDFQIWATGGLETMLFTALAVQALLLTRGERTRPARSLGAGLLLALLTLTRPDGLLFAAAGAASWWLPPDRLARRQRLVHTALCLFPVLLVLAVWLPWKLAYYGELLPTAFYSKSAARPYWSQGIVYAGLYLVKNWVLLAALLGAALLWVQGGGRDAEDPGWDERFFLGAALLYSAQVVYVGGDFMFARRLLPAVPFLLLALEGWLVRWPRPAARAWLGAVALAAAALPLPLFDHWARIENVGEERNFYPPEVVAQRREQARAVGQALAGTPARVAFEGGMCVFGFYSRLPYLVEITGLTQYSLAKRPLAERGFIGHEKVADDEWLTRNGIHFVVSQDLPPVRPEPGVLKVDEIRFGDLARARIHLYDDAVMDPLRADSRVQFTPIERVLALSAERMQAAPLARARSIYQELRRYYLARAGQRGAAWDARLLRILTAKARKEAGEGRPTRSEPEASEAPEPER
jgi:hypothetical protein